MYSTTCAECGQKHSSMRGLSFHIKVHGLNSEEYSQKYLGQVVNCGCGKRNTFKGLSLGYTAKCEACARRDSAIESKQRLKEDEKKFAAFRQRTSKGMIGVWAKRDAKDISPYFNRTFIGNFVSADHPLEKKFHDNFRDFFNMGSD